MSTTLKIIIGILIPFLGTTLGAATVFVFKKEMGEKIQKTLLGFAAGVMLAAAIWSLILPSIEQSSGMGKLSWLPAAVGFLVGIAFLLGLDTLIPHLHLTETKPEGKPSKISKSFMLILAVTLHNIPEGLSVGVGFAGILEGSQIISTASAFMLAFGIALQNFPEGATVSAPLVTNGLSKGKAFVYGMLSGVVEPISAVLAMFLASLVTPALPYVLSFAAGAMVYVVVEELIPEAQSGEHTNVGTIGVSIGFVLMMVLDIAFG